MTKLCAKINHDSVSQIFCNFFVNYVKQPHMQQQSFIDIINIFSIIFVYQEAELAPEVLELFVQMTLRLMSNYCQNYTPS